MRQLTFCALLLCACGETIDGMDIDAGGGGGVQPTFTSLYGDYLSNCKSCHAPGAPGRDEVNIEKTLDFTNKTTAYTSIKGMASGLTGNFKDCNGVPFVNMDASKSLLLASLDQPTRKSFDLSTFPMCDEATISDQTVKVGSSPSTEFIAALKMWLVAGSPNN